MLKVDNITVYDGQIQALKDGSIDVNEGEIVSLIGANGAGKSTTLRTISGLLRSKTGSITLFDEDISKTEAYRLVSRGLAHVPEGRRVFLQMTVLENLEMGAFTTPSNVKEGIAEVFERFPRLKHRKNQIAGTLSGGEQQILAMGRALMSRPKILMLDEPSMGLAPILVQQIFDIIKELHEVGTTILLVEQNAEMALNIADRAYVLESGRIKLSGSGKELAQSDEIKKSYLGG
ncbi:MAG: ABC transporter ATP-binding protein [Clostridia bacterium]|nr:ABC transporter ATP-binding protein [Clostridia bacterium]